MKCPLLKHSVIVDCDLNTDVPMDCLKEKCAWFHPTTQSCEVSRIASNLSTIANYLDPLVVGDTKTAMDTKIERSAKKIVED